MRTRLLPVLLLLACACYREENPAPAVRSADAGEPILFTSAEVKSGDAFRVGDSFLVWARAEDGTDIMVAQPVFLTEEGWSYAPLKYWPDGQQVSFLAVSPCNSEIIERDSEEEDVFFFTSPDDASADMMVSPPVTAIKGDAVCLNFTHTLFNLEIRVKLQGPLPRTKSVRVRRIRIGPHWSECGWSVYYGIRGAWKRKIFSQEPDFPVTSEAETTLTRFYLIPEYMLSSSQMIIDWDLIHNIRPERTVAKSDTVSLAGVQFQQNTILGVTLSINGRYGLIDFKDPRVKQACVRVFDTDEDEEISYEEAAAVTVSGFGHAFRNTTIRWFPEVGYFTQVTEFPDSCFFGCPELEEIAVPEQITRYGKSAFQGCASLPTLRIPQGMTAIPEHLFDGCISLDGITLPEGTRTVGTAAFRECRTLSEIRFPRSVQSLGDISFAGCTHLQQIESIPATAPSTTVHTFGWVHSGNEDQLAGGEISSGKKLIIRFVSSGYDEKAWLVLRNQAGFDVLLSYYD